MADGLHLHLRGPAGGHNLDADMYRQALATLKTVVPQMVLQITTEAIGIYTPKEQGAIVGGVQPEHVSIAECLARFPHAIERVGFEAGTMSPPVFWSESRRLWCRLHAGQWMADTGISGARVVAREMDALVHV